MRGVFLSGWCGFRELFMPMADDFSFYTPFYDNIDGAFAAGGRNLVCWSTGSNLALRQASLPFDNIILAAPFVRFTDHTPEKILRRMIKKFAADQHAVIGDFMAACGCPSTYVPADADMAKLMAGLEYLLDSGGEVIKGLKSVKVIHGENDAIVNIEAGRAVADMLGAELITVKNCGHYIPQEVLAEYLI